MAPNNVSAIEKHETEMLSRAVEAYLVDRYQVHNLRQLVRRDIQEHDGQLARTLYNWREAAQWKKPHRIGEYRCVSCTKVMGDELSACEDETVCADCAKDLPLSEDPTHAE